MGTHIIYQVCSGAFRAKRALCDVLACGSYPIPSLSVMPTGTPEGVKKKFARSCETGPALTRRFFSLFEKRKEIKHAKRRTETGRGAPYRFN
jgi:hypothetical protein